MIQMKLKYPNPTQHITEFCCRVLLLQLEMHPGKSKCWNFMQDKVIGHCIIQFILPHISRLKLYSALFLKNCRYGCGSVLGTLIFYITTNRYGSYLLTYFCTWVDPCNINGATSTTIYRKTKCILLLCMTAILCLLLGPNFLIVTLFQSAKY